MNASKAIEVTINDASIFNKQTGFRRAEYVKNLTTPSAPCSLFYFRTDVQYRLLPLSNTGTDASTLGQKTIHFSIRKDVSCPLNVSHEYQLFFLESANFATNQIVLKTGTILGSTNASTADDLVMLGNVASSPPQMLFSAPFTENTWHNFGVMMDFDKKTTAILYSTDEESLTPRSAAMANDVSGQGQFHFGLLKKPINGGADITKSGEQPAGINEGVIYGGIFEENSADGCISLSP
jgi:hypothetical protein